MKPLKDQNDGACSYNFFRLVQICGHVPRRENLNKTKPIEINVILPAVVIRFDIRGMAFANGLGIVACLPFPVNSHSHSYSLPIPWGGGVNHSSHDFPAKKQEMEQVVRNRMEEQTARNKQAEAWRPALLVSAQNKVIPAHSSSVPVSAVGAAAAQQRSFCRLSSMIQKLQWERSVLHLTVLRSSRVLLLACCHFT